jgi:polysaccharide pyruvyl transferase WcaK-like protein
MVKRLRVGLLWHSLRAGNLGVGALTLGNIAIIREVAASAGVDVDFVVLSMRESSTDPIAEGIDQYEIDTRRLISPDGFRAKVDTLDCVIDIGAGDSFADIYGPKRFGFLYLTKKFAVDRGKPLILAPQTIGPFTRQPYRWLASRIMRRSECVVARDEQSLAAIEELAPSAKSALAVDVAFKLPFDDQSSDCTVRKYRIGINASGLLCRQAESGENRFGLSFDYLALHRRLIAHFSSRDDCEVFLVTHANSAGDTGDDDGTRADQLSREFPGVTRVPDFAGPSQAKSFISSLDFIVAGRMHACIAAFSSETPVIPISYSRKFSGLFGLLEYPWLTPVTGWDEDEAFHYIVRSFNEREAMKKAQGTALQRVEEMLAAYRETLFSLFKRLPGQAG